MSGVPDVLRHMGDDDPKRTRAVERVIEQERAQTGFAPVDGATIYYEIAGKGRPLLSDHGIGGKW